MQYIANVPLIKFLQQTNQAVQNRVLQAMRVKSLRLIKNFPRKHIHDPW